MQIHRITENWSRLPWNELIRDLGYIAACVILVNLAGITEPSLNVDDYSQFGGAGPAWDAHGRWLLTPFFDAITLGAFAPPLLTLLGSVFLAATGLAIAVILGADPGIDRIIIGAMFGSHPYFIDMMNFNTAALAYPFAFFITALAILASNMRPLGWFIPLGSLLLCFSLAIYQATLSVFATLFVFVLGTSALGQLRFPTIDVRAKWLPLAAIGVLGVIIYFSLTKILVGSGSGRTELISNTEDILAKIRYLYYSLQETILSPELLIPASTKIILGLIFLATIHAAWSNARKQDNSIVRATLYSAIMSGLLFSVLLASYTPVLPLNAGLPPRAMVGHAVFTAIFAAVLFALGRQYHRAIGISLACILIFQYAIIANELMYKQRLLQSIDMTMASALRDRIASEPDFNGEANYQIVCIGEHDGPWESQSSVLQSAFSRDWSQRGILKLYGIKATAPSQETRSWALQQSSEMGIWPSHDAIRIDDDRIVIRLR
jgi:hypothetical protein